MDIGIVSWRFEQFEKTFPAVASVTPNMRRIICCSDKEHEKYAAKLAGSGTFLLTPKMCQAVFENVIYDTTLGHCRNLIAMASHILDKKTPLVFLDDDVYPDANTITAFERAFQKYDLVQGQYTGDVASDLYLTVHFFNILERAYAQTMPKKEDIEMALDCLSGKYKEDNSKPTHVKGAAGGVLGRSPRLKLASPVCPTIYRIEDSFFEFYNRYTFRQMRFMDESTSMNDIPVVMHERRRYKPDYLISSYLLELKSSLVEAYLYYKVSKSIKKKVDGKFYIIPLPQFNIEEVTNYIIEGGAVRKFQSAAEFYLKKNLPEEIARELEKIIKIKAEDIFVSEKELEDIYALFEKERTAIKKISNLETPERKKLQDEITKTAKV